MRLVRLASAAMAGLLAGRVGFGAAPSGSASRRIEIRRTYGEVAGKLRQLYENLYPGGEQELDALMDRSWSLVEEWMLAYLGDHPNSSPADLVADLRTLSPVARSQYDDVPGPLEAEAIGLASGADAAYAVAVHSGSGQGTVLIAARSGGGVYRIAWRIRDVPLDKRAEQGELGRWRIATPGWHDGPLDGQVLRAPDDTSGHARFWVDAMTNPDAGLICPAQISLWRWTGRTAVLEYVSMYDAPGRTHVEQRGDLLRLQVSTPLTCFAPCGACDGPHSTWSLRVKDGGIEDLGRVDDEPELLALHELFQRVAAGDDASELAAPDAIAYLKSQYADMREKIGNDGEADCWAGLLSEHRKVDHAGAKSRLDVWVDRFYPLSIRFESRNGRLFVTAIEEHPERQ